MRILMTADVVGGVWDVCCALAAELTGVGHEVMLLAFGEPSASQREQAKASSAPQLFEPLRLEWMPDSAGDVESSRQVVRDLVREFRPDVVHANQFALGGLDLPAPIVLAAHSDVLSWGKWTHGWRETPDEWTDYAAMVREGLLGADRVVAVSAFLANEVEALYRLERSVGVIHNGWPGPPTAPEPAGRPRLSVLGGRAWDDAKNFSLALLAVRGWDCGRVVFAGEVAHPVSSSEAALGGRIEPLGRLPQSELFGWLGQARVYASPARYDPFGLLPLQAALAGCALLLSDIPSYRELWHGAAAFFASDDEASMRQQWMRLLGDESYAAALADRAWQRAVDAYTSDRMAGEYLACYRAAVESREAAREVMAW
jgi:glycogen synthase